MLRWKIPQPTKERCSDMAFAPGDREVLVTPFEKKVLRLDRQTGQPVEPAYATSPPGRVLSLAVSPDGQYLYGGSVGKIYRWELATNRFDRVIAEGQAERLALSPDGTRLLTSYFWTPPAHLVDAQSGRLIRKLEWPPGLFMAQLFWSPDGKTLYTSRSRALYVWDGVTGEPKGEPFPLGVSTLSFSFHPAGHTLIAGTRDNVVRQWDPTTWKDVGPPLPHQGRILRTAYSRDGRLILATDTFTVARLWHPGTGKPVGPRLKGDLPAVSPDNRDFVLDSTDGYLCLYALPTRWEGEVEQVAAWIEGITGQRLDERGVLNRSDTRGQPR
jgi:WD40 repeat protein